MFGIILAVALTQAGSGGCPAGMRCTNGNLTAKDAGFINVVAQGLDAGYGHIQTFGAGSFNLGVGNAEEIHNLTDVTGSSGAFTNFQIDNLIVGNIVSTANSLSTVIDCDITAQATQSMATDTTYSMCGLTWTKLNSTNDNVAMAVTNGVGLTIQPKSTGDYYNGTRTAPMLALPLTANISGTFGPWSFIEACAHLTYNGAANFDSAGVALDHSSGSMNSFAAYRGINSTSIGSQATVGGTGQGFNSVTTNVSTHDVVCITMPGGIGSARAFVTSGAYSSGWPSAANMALIGAQGADDNLLVGTGGFSNATVTLWAKRAGSGTALAPVFKHFRVRVRN